MFGKSYKHKMQVLLSISDAKQLVKIFGVDYFDVIQVRNSNLELIKLAIKPSYMEVDRFKNFNRTLTKLEGKGYLIEFIKK
jgi:hypothetical protein